MSHTEKRLSRLIVGSILVAHVALLYAQKCPADVVEEVSSTKAFGTVTAVTFSPGGDLLAVAGSKRTVYLLKPEDGSEIRSIAVPKGSLYSLAFNATGRLLAGGLLNEIVIWDTTTGGVAHSIKGRMGRVATLSFSKDGTIMAAAGGDAKVHLFETETWDRVRALQTRGTSSKAVDFSSDGKTLAGACGSRVLFWDVEDPIPQRKIAAHKGKTIACLFGADDNALITAGDKSLLVWNIEDGEAIHDLDDQKGRLTAVGMSADKRLLASAAQDRSVFLRNPSDARLLHRIDDTGRAAECLALGPEANYLACGMRSPGTTFVLWKLDPAAITAGDGIIVGEDIEADFLTRLERRVIEEQNLARANPKKYASYLRQYRNRYRGRMITVARNMELETREGVKAVDEAIAELRELDPLPPLAPYEGMSLAAKDHVLDIGPRGTFGHNGTDGSSPWDRVGRYGSFEYPVSENIAFGQDDPRTIVLQLIVDDGVPGRMHRKNIFNREYRATGVHYGRHRRLGSLCVITYAKKYKEKAEQ